MSTRPASGRPTPANRRRRDRCRERLRERKFRPIEDYLRWANDDDDQDDDE